MGADLLTAILIIDEKREPNWIAAEAALHAATVEELKTTLDDVGELDEDEEYAHEDLFEIIQSAMNDCKDAVEGGSRGATYYSIRGAYVYFTGEMSWGDMPDLVRSFCIFSASPGYEAAGFE